MFTSIYDDATIYNNILFKKAECYLITGYIMKNIKSSYPLPYFSKLRMLIMKIKVRKYYQMSGSM